MSTKHSISLFTVTILLIFALAVPTGGATATGEKIGLIIDEAGIAGSAWNELAYQGLLRAQTDFGVIGSLYEPADNTEYAAKIQECITDGNILCIGTSIMLAADIETAANANPSVKFAVLDGAFDAPPVNLRGMTFNSKEVGYLAGTLAGNMSVTHNVGVVAGMQVPPVEAFVDGYRNGAYCSAPVEVLVNYTGTFSDPSAGEAAAADLISRSADVIFTVGGQTGNGALLYATQHSVWGIGVDTDTYVTLFGNGTVAGSDKLLTSAMKNLDVPVYQVIKDTVGGLFTSGTMTYDLKNGGVGLAPFHETDGDIPQAVKDELAAIEQGIINGTIDIDYPCQPRFHAEIIENDVFGVDWLGLINVTLTIDDPSNGVGVDFTDTKKTNQAGYVMFDNLGGLTLTPGMFITMTDGDILKEHTVVNLTVEGVGVQNDTVWGTGVSGDWLNIQHCDAVGCSWRRLLQVQPDGTWLADFSVPGGPSPEEQNLLNITYGTTGEALDPDTDADHTDVAWSTPVFDDVSSDFWAADYISSLLNSGITGGCSITPFNYCPGITVTRDQMAVFLLRGEHGSAYTPPPATGTMFSDVPSTHWAAAWIEQLANEGITGGCGPSAYCPSTPVTRDQMAVFLLRGEHGGSYTPPPATGTMFADVPSTHWAAAWIEQLANEGITGGCGSGNYCPATPVTRDQMAVFLVRAFNLP